MKNALVMGMRLSGAAAAGLLEKEGFAVRRYDDRLDIQDNWKERGEEIYAGLDLAVVSPSIENTHPVLEGLKARGIPVVSELELGQRFLTGTKIIVTGTNGKTTTVDMLDKALKTAGLNARTMGNVGYPVSQVVLDGLKYDYNIIEASSFQLEYTYTLRPRFAAFLNIAPDHMDRYDDFNAYFAAKCRPFAAMTAEDYAVLNYDSPKIRDFGSRLGAKVLWVSTRSETGIFYIKNNYFYMNGQPLISVKESKVRGEHNRFNMMTAMNIAALIGADKEQLKHFVRSYRALPHRIEYICAFGGKRYYNDSKGTNIAATLGAVESVGGRIGLIMGGSDKKEDYCDFFLEIPGKVEYVVATGANAEKILGSALKTGFNDIETAPTLEEAADILKNRPGIDTVLFSPASASFDRYSNYAERGERFKNIVYALR